MLRASIQERATGMNTLAGTTRSFRGDLIKIPTRSLSLFSLQFHFEEIHKSSVEHGAQWNKFDCNSGRVKNYSQFLLQDTSVN